MPTACAVRSMLSRTRAEDAPEHQGAEAHHRVGAGDELHRLQPQFLGVCGHRVGVAGEACHASILAPETGSRERRLFTAGPIASAAGLL